jgi:hypothetical protein
MGIYHDHLQTYIFCDKIEIGCFEKRPAIKFVVTGVKQKGIDNVKGVVNAFLFLKL